VGLRAGLDGCGKSRPTGIRSPDRPARSESLYRLSHPGPYVTVRRKKSDQLLTILREASFKIHTATLGDTCVARSVTSV